MHRIWHSQGLNGTFSATIWPLLSSGASGLIAAIWDPLYVLRGRNPKGSASREIPLKLDGLLGSM